MELLIAVGAAVLIHILASEVCAHAPGVAARLIGLAARDDWFLFGCVRLSLGDVTLVSHPLKHDVAPLGGALQVHERALTLGGLKDAGNERGLLDRG